MLLDEPTSQLDPVAGDELLGVLRRLNEEWGTAVVLAEHRLERCLAAADRVIALRRTARVAFDADPARFLELGGRAAPALQTPGARLFALAGLARRRSAVKDARADAARPGLLGAARPGPADGAAPAPRARRRRRARGRRALAFGGVWLEIPRGPRGAARRRSLARAGRAGRADGPQRRRQVDAAARSRPG